MAQSPVQIRWKYLERDPLSSYFQLSIKGRRIKARTLYGLFLSAEEPRTIEEIAADFQVPLAAVEEAILYCKSNPPEIEQDFQREEALMEATGMNEPEYKYHPSPKSLSPQEWARIRKL